MKKHKNTKGTRNRNAILESIRKRGRNGDTILAHINPLEASLLKSIGGSGTINPKTGLPEFGLFKKPGKWFASNIGGGAGAILGNVVAPGIGGVVGGGLGGALGSKARGRKDALQAGLRGMGIGATIPSLASLTGGGLSSLGAEQLGSSLSEYGANNSILTSLGLGGQMGAGATNAGALASTSPNIVPNALPGVQSTPMPVSESFFDKLTSRASDYATKPENWLSLFTLGSGVYDKMNQKKPLTPEQEGANIKKRMLASRLTPAEIAEQEKLDLLEAQAKRRVARNKFLPEERINIEPLYTRVSTPEEFAETKRWFNYYNNPQFKGNRVNF